MLITITRFTFFLHAGVSAYS